MKIDLSNQVALITGSAQGIGAETARSFAESNAHVVINDLNLEKANEFANKLSKEFSIETLVSGHDVSDHDQAKALLSEVKTRFKRLDILVNNAGITRDAMLHKLTEEQWDEVIRVNLKGPFNMGQAAFDLMKENHYGRIVNLASVAWLGNIGQTNYSASKAGVVGLTHTWAKELARHGITVNAIAPGLIETEMTKKIPQEVKDAFNKKIPLGRMGFVSEPASLITFLASPQAAYITGQVIQIDGGLSVGI